MHFDICYFFIPKKTLDFYLAKVYNKSTIVQKAVAMLLRKNNKTFTGGVIMNMQKHTNEHIFTEDEVRNGYIKNEIIK